jgi:hypothetical protein
VDQSRVSLQAKRSDHPLDFAPAAEMDDIAQVAAAPGTAAGFGRRMVSEMGNQFRGLGKGAAAGDMNGVTQNTPRQCLCLASSRLSVAKMVRCNGKSKFIGGSRRGWSDQSGGARSAAMDRRSKFTRAGGSILAISILAGTVGGIIIGQPSIGVLAGTAAGGLLALLFWLNERRL